MSSQTKQTRLAAGNASKQWNESVKLQQSRNRVVLFDTKAGSRCIEIIARHLRAWTAREIDFSQGR